MDGLAISTEVLVESSVIFFFGFTTFGRFATLANIWAIPIDFFDLATGFDGGLDEDFTEDFKDDLVDDFENIDAADTATKRAAKALNI